MTNPQSPLPGKIRTRQHVIADLGVNYLERFVLLCGYALERIRYDYGYDLTMTSFDEQGVAEGGTVYFQVKATDNLITLRDGQTISWAISRRDLKLWLQDVYPVILIVFDAQQSTAYWLYVQAYFAEYPLVELFTAGQTINVHIPFNNRITREAIRTIRRFKENVRRQVLRKVDHHVE